MADSRKHNRKYNRAYGTSYIGDNLARRQAVVTPMPEHHVRVTKESEKVSRTKGESKTGNGLAASFGFAFTLIMAAAMVVIFITMVKYISLNIEISRSARTISGLRKELTSATMENDNMEMAINASIDYNYIYQVATEELGMVYASKDQIVTYGREDSEYVVQYKDVE